MKQEKKNEIQESLIEDGEEFSRQSGSGLWMPEEEGSVLKGTVTEIVEGDYGRQYRITIDGTKETVLTPSHKMLQSRLALAKVNDRVKIVFLGEDAPAQKGWSPTRLYEVWLKKA